MGTLIWTERLGKRVTETYVDTTMLRGPVDGFYLYGSDDLGAMLIPEADLRPVKAITAEQLRKARAKRVFQFRRGRP